MARGAPTVAGTQALRHLTWEHATCVELMSRKDLGEAYQNSFFFFFTNGFNFQFSTSDENSLTQQSRLLIQQK